MSELYKEKTAICTIASVNYTAYVKTLAQSVEKYHPEIDFFFLVVDRKTPEVVAAVDSMGLNAFYAEDLEIPDFEMIAFKFDVVELNTALKPTMLKNIFSLGYNKLLYLDPDIRIFAELSPVLQALDDHNIVFTPHSQQPIMDEYRPSDIDFLRTGGFNLGFVGLKASDQSSKMLDWWEQRCLAYGFNEVSGGIFVDQKWMDLVPCYFSGVHILKHVGCNVAYWNLHERSVSGSRNNYSVDGKPLCFFHFSGIKANQPDILSKHQTRHNLVAGTPLAELVSDYCNTLNENDHDTFSKIKYTFSSFDNGISITKLARRTACFALNKYSRPFCPKDPFYSFLQSNGLLANEEKSSISMTTRDFDQSTVPVRFTNLLVRICAKLIGSGRLSALIRYMNILSRDDNLARVLCKEPLDFVQNQHRSRQL